VLGGQGMRSKQISGFIILFFILSILFVSWNKGYYAGLPASTHQMISGNDQKPLKSEDKNWSQIEVISEPFSGKNLNTGDSYGCDIIAENEKIYVVWSDENNTNGAGTDSDIFYRQFDGNIWSDTQVISEPLPGQNINTGASWNPQIIVENDNIYVVWLDGNNTSGAGTDSDIFFRCNLTGSSWEPIQVISEPIFGKNFNTAQSWASKIAVEDGNIYIVWQDHNNTNAAGTDWDIFYRCNLTGSSWEDIQVISEPVFGQNVNTGSTGGPAIAIESGNIYVIWSDNTNLNSAGTDEDIFYRCNLTGTDWDDIQIISEPIPGQNIDIAYSRSSDIAVENGKIYAVWHDGNETDSSGVDTDIFFMTNLTGTGWEPVQVISEPVAGQNLNTGYSYYPSIAVRNGKVYTVWQDENNTNNAGTDIDIFFRSNLTGTTWESVQVISEPNFGQNLNTESYTYQVPSIAVGYRLSVVWDDENNTEKSGTDLDISYRWKYIAMPSLFISYPKVTPKVGNTSTEFNFSVIYNQLNNTPPTRMKVIVDGIEHSMLETDILDINYSNGKKYYFKMKYFDIGIHTYEFNASDGVNYTNTRLFSNLIVENTPPQIITEDNLTSIEDEYYETNYDFIDVDIAYVGQECHWEFESNAEWLNFDPINGILSGTPENANVGQYWVYVAVNDTIDIDFTNFTLTVLDVNDLPIIVTNNIGITYEDALYEVDYNATDIDSLKGNQFWSLKTNATSWLNISSSNGIVNGTPGNDEVGKYWINITVDDNEGGIDFTNFTLTVLNVNDLPLISTQDLITAETDKLYEMDYNATDIDSPSSKQTWTLSTNASWLSIDTTTGVLSGTPTRSDAGWFMVNVTVSDGDGGIDWHRFILTINLGNLPPIIITEDVETARVNKSYEVDYNATDDRTHPNFLTWALETNASWLVIDKTMGILSGTPGPEHGGKQYWVKVTALDHENGWDIHNFTLTVLKEPKPKNNIPRLTNFKLIPFEGDTETEFTYTVNYFDLDNDLPTFIQVVINGIAYDMDLISGETPYKGKYEYKTTLSEGEHSYYFIASDGKDTNTSGTLNTPKIEKPVEVDNSETEKEGFAWEWMILVFVIIIIIVLIFLFLMMRRKKKEEKKIIPPSELEMQKQDAAPTQKQVQTEIPATYPDYYTSESPIQEDLYYIPPEETTTPITPDYTTPVQPESEPGFEPIEEDEVLEE
jgi:hypothetical protein